jgi:DNA-binding transcriptional LysR family regulator
VLLDRLGPQHAAVGLALDVVARGFGYAILIQRPAVDRTYEGLPVVVREITPASPGGGVRMIWPRGVRLSDRAAAMVAFATEHARDIDPRMRRQALGLP